MDRAELQYRKWQKSTCSANLFVEWCCHLVLQQLYYSSLDHQHPLLVTLGDRSQSIVDVYSLEQQCMHGVKEHHNNIVVAHNNITQQLHTIIVHNNSMQ